MKTGGKNGGVNVRYNEGPAQVCEMKIVKKKSSQNSECKNDQQESPGAQLNKKRSIVKKNEWMSVRRKEVSCKSISTFI